MLDLAFPSLSKKNPRVIPSECLYPPFLAEPEEVFGGPPNTYSQGVWKTRVETSPILITLILTPSQDTWQALEAPLKGMGMVFLKVPTKTFSSPYNPLASHPFFLHVPGWTNPETNNKFTPLKMGRLKCPF